MTSSTDRVFPDDFPKLDVSHDIILFGVQSGVYGYLLSSELFAQFSQSPGWLDDSGNTFVDEANAPILLS